MVAMSRVAAQPAPGLWVEALRRRREPLNERVAAAVAAGADPEMLREALRHIGVAVSEPLAVMTQQPSDEWVDGWVEAVVTTIADAVGRGAWGPHALTPWVLGQVALPLAPHVREAGLVLADLLRAADRLWGRADLALWGRLVGSAVAAQGGLAEGGTVAPALVRDLGAVAGWRAGDVRLRDAAHRVAAALPAATAAAVLGLPPDTDVAAVLAANRAVPQAWPGVGTRRIGGHAALGGCFTTPPRVLAGDGLRWQVQDGPDGATRTLLLIADSHGWMVTPDADGWIVTPDADPDSPQGPPVTTRVPPPPGAEPARWAAYQAGGCRIGVSATSFHLLVGALP
jgi:hypothetical protein